jgi:hypothetical protein
LLLERLLRLVEQPHILDRNHSLVGEGLEERDLVVTEPAGFAARYRDRATPRMTAQDANVCRRVWKVTSSSWAASTALF